MSAGVETVAVSTRIRLARNFRDYPFPNRLGKEAARGIVDLVAAELKRVDAFELHYLDAIPPWQAELMKERYLISSDLIRNREISAVLLSRSEGGVKSFDEELEETLRESTCVMINEEDHIREQYFMRGADLRRGYERLSGIDDIISETIPFAFDDRLGYLTACPSNLGTGLRASVMLFLPGLSQRGEMKRMAAELRRAGLTVRGAFGEGSGSEGFLFQISNRFTLGEREEDILSLVEEKVEELSREELAARTALYEDGGVALADRVMRSFGVLTNCMRIGEHEFLERIADVKLGVALGFLEGDLCTLDTLLVSTRPANLGARYGRTAADPDLDTLRAAYAGKFLRRMGMWDESKREELFPEELYGE